MSSQSEFTYISTFAGCGGSSLGYKWAGGRGLCAIEFDANAAATYRLNFPETPVIERDIREVTAEEVLKVAGIGVGQLDVLDGSPPCQGFSTAGKRKLTDSRNDLFREFIRLIEGLQPKVFVMENVSGLVKGKMKYVFRDIMLALKATGYNVRCKLLNAMWFGVPQSRERLIWIGAKEWEPGFPKADGKAKTVREAWKGHEAEHGTPPNGTLLKLVQHMPAGANNGGGNISLPLVGNVQFFGAARLHWDRPSPTVIKTWQRLFHPDFNAPPSTAQAKLLASFPLKYRFIGNEAETWACIGNSVPPRFMQAIAETIRDSLLPEHAGLKGTEYDG